MSCRLAAAAISICLAPLLANCDEPVPDAPPPEPTLSEAVAAASWTDARPRAAREWHEAVARLGGEIREKAASEADTVGRALEWILRERRVVRVCPPSTARDGLHVPSSLRMQDMEPRAAGLAIACLLQEAGITCGWRLHPDYLVLETPDGRLLRADDGSAIDAQVEACRLGYIQADAARLGPSGYLAPVGTRAIQAWHSAALARRHLERQEPAAALARSQEARACLDAPFVSCVLGEALANLGRAAEAEPHLKSAWRDPVWRGPATLALARAARARGDLELATHLLGRAREGATRAEATARTVDLLLARADLDAAQRLLPDLSGAPSFGPFAREAGARLQAERTGRGALQAIPPPRPAPAPGPAAASEGLTLLQDLTSPDPGTRERAATTLRARGAALASDLRAAATDPRPGIRAAAFGCLADAEPSAPETLESLAAGLRDADGDVAAAAARAAARTRSAGAVEPLRAALQGATAEPLRSAAAYALAELGSEHATPFLLEEMSAPVPRRRWTAARYLGLLGRPDATPALLAALTDDSSRVRMHAAEALGALGSRDAVGPLVGLLGDEEPDVRRRAAAALERITGQKHGVDAEAWRRWIETQQGPEEVY